MAELKLNSRSGIGSRQPRRTGVLLISLLRFRFSQVILRRKAITIWTLMIIVLW